MSALLRGYGALLTGVFFAAVALWALLLIVLPQLTMLERALIAPERQLDSSVALRLIDDAKTCGSILEGFGEAESAAPGVPSMTSPSASGGIAIPSASGGIAIPSASGPSAGAVRPTIIQCERTNTRQQLVRGQDVPPAWLDEVYGLPRLAVTNDVPIADQIAKASEIAIVATGALEQAQSAEATRSRYTLGNFGQLFAPRLIPLSPEQRAQEDARLSKQAFGLLGLRFERDGAIYERLGMITLVRTIFFAALATGLALILCYPIAYKVALASGPGQAVWLFLGLIIPYTIAELMRIYAWTIIIDNQGLINSIGMSLGLIGEAVQFKRFPGTVFVVIVYTYVLFMVFPIVNVMSTLDRNQIEAARDLGARAWRVHWRVIIPHAKPGIAVGCIATFMLAAGAFSVPRIISRGLQAEWFSQTIYSRFFEGQSDNIGAAYSFFYTVICFVIVALFMWIMRTRLKDFARAQ